MSEKPIEVAAGVAGTLRLRVIPQTSIKLATPAFKVAAIRTNVTLTGTVQNLPNGTKARFTWIVTRGGAVERYPLPDVGIKVQSGTQASVTVPLDVIEQRLLGAGSVGFEIAPDFPYCQPQTVSPGAITFDNPLSISLDAPAQRFIGTETELVPSFGSVFDKATIKVEIRESDRSKDETAGSDGLSLDILWKPGDQDEKSWRIGCQNAVGAPVLDYMEANEAGGYEFEYAVSISTDVNKKDAQMQFVRLIEAQPLVNVPAPKLASFELVEVVEEGFAFFSEPDVRKILHAKGVLSGFDPKLKLPLKISLWEATASGEARRVKDIEVDASVGKNGAFEAHLATYSKQKDPSVWSKLAASMFFAVLRVPREVTGTKRDEVLSRVFAYDHAAFIPFLEGEGASVLRGTGLCTKGARLTVIRDVNERLAKFTVGPADAHHELAESRKAGAERFKELAMNIGEKHDVPPAMVLAWMNQESGFGLFLDKNGYSKTDGNGYGLFQVDKRYHTLTGDPYGMAHADQAMEIYKNFLTGVAKNHPDWTPEEHMIGALVEYNSGTGAARTRPSDPESWRKLDSGTAHNNYSRSIIGQAQWYWENLTW